MREELACDRCGRKISGAYMGDADTGKVFCSGCILGRRYDHKAIREMYGRGASIEAIARHVGTNPLTVGWIVRNG